MADPICRFRNPYVKTIIEFVKVLPHEAMPSDKFRTIVEKRWPDFFRTAYQLACQVGLYYESDEGIYYPRFDHDIDETEAFSYMKRWITRYYVPNPYTKSIKTLKQPLPFLASIISFIFEHPDEKDLHSILNQVFQEDIGNIDIISNVLNTYTDLMKVDNNGNVDLTDKAKDFMKQFIDRNDKKAFFEIFSEEVTETKQEEFLRQASAATFLRNALKVVIEEDSNLSRLAALNKYKETKKQLKINGFNLWRKKDDLPLRLEDVYQDLEIEYNNRTYVMYLEWTPADMESLFFPLFNIAYNGKFAMAKEGNEYVLYKISEYRKEGYLGLPLQQIFYGAPGTGKSHEIKDQTKRKSVIRTTFHPDSDYSTFVGCYKPSIGKGRVYGAQGPLTEYGKPIEEPKITYKYVTQAFLKAYLGAWKKYVDRDGDEAEPQFLVIEEINRGNCAQIFGDIFQLLDRSENGFSEYPIEADTDLQHEIERAFKDDEDYKLISDINVEGVVEDYTSNYNSTLSEDIQHGRVLLLPKNLYLWATMNTSDQSLFPIDSAFKRRWDWVYMPIGYRNNNWIIEIGEKKYSWIEFQHKINERIYDVDNSEDKQLGDYFVNADRTGLKISANTFLNKILFYIWNDVCKDDPDQIFRWIDKKEEKSIKFSDFFDKDKDKKLQGFMAFHKVPAIGESTNSDATEEESETVEPEIIESPAEDDNDVNS